MNEISIKELLDAGKALGSPVAAPGFKPVCIIPEGYHLANLEHAEAVPILPYIKQQVSLSDTESFVAYVRRYQSIDTLLFGTLPQQDGNGAEFRAVFDYHAGGKGNEVKAGRAAHQAVFPCPLSLNFQVWQAQSGKGMNQEAFVNFIESNSCDIVSPDAVILMEMALNFEAKTEVTFLSKMDRLTGTRKLTYNEEVNGSKTVGSLTVPAELKIRVPIFESGEAFDLQVRLEWRPSSGKLTVTPHVLRAHDVIRAAVASIRAEIIEEVDLIPMIGKLL